MVVVVVEMKEELVRVKAFDGGGIFGEGKGEGKGGGGSFGGVVEVVVVVVVEEMKEKFGGG